MQDLPGIKVAIFVMDGFEEAELLEPLRALKEAGAHADVISKERGTVQGFRHHEKAASVNVGRTFDEVRPEEYDAILLPGGTLNADTTRMQPKVRDFIRSFDAAGKPIAAICHAPWELISAGVVRGRRLTSYWTIQDDIRNAGGQWMDQECVVDGNLVTSRQPSDLPAFNREMLAAFTRIPTAPR